MARGLNKVMIIGRMERDPEMRYTPSGHPVTSFSVATPHYWVSADGERHQETEWFNVVAWGNLAKICYDHLQKGKQVYIEGRLKTRSWEDQEGKRHFRTEIVAKEMLVLEDDVHPRDDAHARDDAQPFEDNDYVEDYDTF